MIQLYSPTDEMQLAVLRSIFEAEGIPIFVHNDHFGSMRIGVQIELLNRKTIMVAEEHYERACAVIREYLANLEPEPHEQAASSAGYSVLDKVRMIVEFLLFGWIMPGRRRKR